MERPWPARRRRRGFWRSLPRRLLALGAFGLVAYAGFWVYQDQSVPGATVPKVAKAASSVPEQAAPKPLKDQPGVLNRSVEGVAFPDLTRFGWRPFGVRQDVVEGRLAVTVFYLSGFRELRYTIVSGRGDVDNAKAAQISRSLRGGRVFSVVLGVPHTQTMVFKRLGRTVVLTAPNAPVDFGETMLTLAAWTAGGRLAF